VLDIYEELFKLLGFRFLKFRKAIEERIGDSINLFTLEEDDISDIIVQKGMRKRFFKTLEKVEEVYSEIFEEVFLFYFIFSNSFLVDSKSF
jgi:hypothetical protein